MSLPLPDPWRSLIRIIAHGFSKGHCIRHSGSCKSGSTLSSGVQFSHGRSNLCPQGGATYLVRQGYFFFPSFEVISEIVTVSTVCINIYC